ncbi:nucleoside/nucleotide kinase family protein [Demetria terragena]|uniref:nucleoside/nucleotide kinase family protein n=1 Tax=Demetria terragena TaxID=63959 RepID=UPI00036DFDAE|nr:nucleoside/nucleotide kinase family protein [Demetria terragena]
MTDLDLAVRDLIHHHRPGERVILGIAGAPGSGKSTVAAQIVARAQAGGIRTVLVPMDGFHLAQEVLDARGLSDIKGAPVTFDAAGYVAMLQRLRERPSETVWAPTFDRALEQAVAGSIAAEPDVDLVVTEGNYLLLQEDPWSQIRNLLDISWFLDPPSEDVRRARLIARHVAFGSTPEHAQRRADGPDGGNAALVAQSRARAGLVINGR